MVKHRVRLVVSFTLESMPDTQLLMVKIINRFIIRMLSASYQLTSSFAGQIEGVDCKLHTIEEVK